ncbi:MAG: cysteine desulfurase [Clostridiales bacterium]|nr:cysteine desulfurase [Clostridiales bacterium]
MIYFDNSSTTMPKKEVQEAINEYALTLYGNPSSLHRLGIDSEKMILLAKREISEIINSDSNEIIFTSGGTESNNLAVIGTAMRNKNNGMHLVTTEFEHASILNAFKYLENQGFEITYIKPDKDGIVNLENVKKAIREDTILVSIMHVNNEIGSIQDIDEIGNYIKKIKKEIYFHVDAVQSFGKLKIDVKQAKIDLLSISAHKIHGYKGIGALYIRKNTRINPLFFGGQQEKGIRPGTENLLGIISFLKAAQLVKKDQKTNFDEVKKIKEIMVEGIKTIENIKFNALNNSIPYILNVSFKGLKGEVLLHALEQRGLFVSTGSACNSKKKIHSHVLEAIELEEKYLDGTIRFSFSSLNTEDEANRAVAIIHESMSFLNRIMRRS